MTEPPLTAEQLFAFFDTHGIGHSTLRHAPTFRVDEGAEVKNALQGGHTKNLFLKDAKHRLWLVSALADARIDLKSLPEKIGSARLSFSSEARLWSALGVRPGSVTPFALINDQTRQVSLVLDRGLADPVLINFHPLSNDATTSITTSDFFKFLSALGYDPLIVEFPHA